MRVVIGEDETLLREGLVLLLTRSGLDVVGLAADGPISEKAVVAHTSHIYDQLDIRPSEDDHRRVLAVVRYLAC